MAATITKTKTIRTLHVVTCGLATRERRERKPLNEGRAPAGRNAAWPGAHTERGPNSCPPAAAWRSAPA